MFSRKEEKVNIHINCPVFTEEASKIFAQTEERILVLKTLLEQFHGEIKFYPEQSQSVLSFKKLID